MAAKKVLLQKTDKKNPLDAKKKKRNVPAFKCGGMVGKKK